MEASVFNALPVVDSPSAALALTIGDYFLFTEDAVQQNNAFAPDSNRVMYFQRISQDRTGGPYPLPSNILKNFTHAIQPVSAGGPYPPSGAGHTELFYPAEGTLKGQGTVGYVRIFDLLT